MKIGVCRGLNDFTAMYHASLAGVDYYEVGFGSLSKFTDDEIKKSIEKLQEYNLPCTVANGFIPGDLKVVGESVDYDALTAYMETGFQRAKEIGVKKIVFGSGKARSFDEGFCPEKAKEQFIYFLSDYASPLAKAADCTIVIEPLRFCESSMIYTVSDAVSIAKLCGKDNIFALADLYHVYGNSDDLSEISSFNGFVTHSHIAEPEKRIYPSLTDKDEVQNIYKKFFGTLMSVGCDTCSVEAHTDNFSKDIVSFMDLFKSLNL